MVGNPESILKNSQNKMKIISKYRDYYDNIAFMYGGGDPKIVYVRDKIQNINVRLHRSQGPKFDMFYKTYKFLFKILIIGNKYFYLVADDRNNFSKYEILTSNNEYFKSHYCNKWTENEILKNLEKCSNGLEGKEKLLNLSRAVGKPIYIVNSFSYEKEYIDFHIHENYVPLYEFGLPNIYPPEQIYQDVAYFISNISNPSPDMQPIGNPPQTDKEKILSHGMDPKKSFRKMQR